MIKVSASSLKLFRSDPRRWYFQKVLKLAVEPESAATNLGKETHAHLEAWIQHATVPKTELARKMLAKFREYPYWPDPNVTQAEERFEFELGGVTFMGFTDGRRPGRTPTHRVVIDWKSTSNLEYACQAGDGLLLDHAGQPDIQGTIYAAREFLEGATDVSAAWLYGLTRLPHTTRLVAVDFDRAKVFAEMDLAVEHGLAMMWLDANRPPLETIPYNTNQCNAFNRPCVFASSCPRAQVGLFSQDTDPLNIATNGEAMTDFLSSIRASFPGMSGPAVAPPPPPPPADDDTPPPPPPEDDDAPPPPPSDEPHPAEVLAQQTVVAVMRDLYTGVESGYINPPEAQGKKPYANVAEAIEGEGATPAKTKSRANPKGKKVTPILASVAEAVVGLERAGIPVKATKAEDTLAAIYAILKAHFEG